MGSIGVDEVVDEDDASGAIMYFTNGDIGYIYKIDGGVGISTVPAIAERVRLARYQYLVGRSSTTQEVLITRVRTAQFTAQLKALHRDAGKANSGSPDDLWRRYMAKVSYDYIYENMRDDDILIEQFLILRENSPQQLRVAAQKLSDGVAAGMYTAAQRLTARETENLLRSLTASEAKYSADDGLKQFDALTD